VTGHVRHAAALSHFQQRHASASIRRGYLKGKLPLLLFGKRTGSAMLTHSQYYDAAVSKSPIRQGNTASPAATLLPPLTSLCRRRRYVLHSLAIIAGLGVANALRETCFTCLRSQVGLVSCSARAALMQSTATFDDLLLFGSLWIYSNRLKLYLSGTSPPPPPWQMHSERPVSLV